MQFGNKRNTINNKYYYFEYKADVAQLVEQRIRNA